MWTQIRLLLYEQSDQGPYCLPVCKNRFEKFARIVRGRHKQTTISDAGFLGILRVKITTLLKFLWKFCGLTLCRDNFLVLQCVMIPSLCFLLWIEYLNDVTNILNKKLHIAHVIVRYPFRKFQIFPLNFKISRSFPK